MISVNKVAKDDCVINLVGRGGTLVDEYIALTLYLIKDHPDLFEEIQSEINRRV